MGSYIFHMSALIWLSGVPSGFLSYFFALCIPFPSNFCVVIYFYINHSCNALPTVLSWESLHLDTSLWCYLLSTHALIPQVCLHNYAHRVHTFSGPHSRSFGLFASYCKISGWSMEIALQRNILLMLIAIELFNSLLNFFLLFKQRFVKLTQMLQST